ncbi:MAG: hypothetical protein WC663_03660 [Patescibacteria group bacterium]|jgi:hypothetical protein
MKKFLLLFFGIFILMGAGCKNDIQKTANQTFGLEALNTEQKLQKDLAESKAKELFAQKANQDLDLSTGPCLAEEIITDWSVDIVHNPRTAVDEKSENQCQNYINGKTHHFVELDLNGDIVNVH